MEVVVGGHAGMSLQLDKAVDLGEQRNGMRLFDNVSGLDSRQAKGFDQIIRNRAPFSFKDSLAVRGIQRGDSRAGRVAIDFKGVENRPKARG